MHNRVSLASAARLAARLAVAVFVCAAIAAPAAHGLGQKGVKANNQVFNPRLSGDGRYMAFSTGANNLSLDDPSGNSDVYVRDLDLGHTQLVSRVSGFESPRQNCQANRPSISDDGRFVAFDSCGTNLSPADTDTWSDVYVRDTQTGTTTLVSRATGAAGAKGDNNSLSPVISADGRYVAYYSTATTLDPLDTDSIRDVFIRDLQTDTTTLVSRAAAKGNADSVLPEISDDGRFVAFRSAATNLPDDTDAANDIFLRDLQAGTTILVSRGPGATGINSPVDSFTPTLSDDGRYVAFGTNAVNFDPADADSNTDVYVRDVQANTTTLVSRASGATGVKGNGLSSQRAMVSGNGRYVVFNSRSTNLTTDDTDSLMDVFVRDLQTDTTTLASRASGAAGPKGNGASSDFLADADVSDDGRFVSFGSEATNLDPDDTDTTTHLFVRDRQDLVTHMESRGTPSFPRPVSASPVKVSLVPAMAQCTASNRTHGPPLASPSCAPPAQVSPYLTVGTPDSNGNPVNSIGFVRYGALVGDPSTPADEADVKITVSVTDVRERPGLGDYAGELAVVTRLRVTDKYNGATQAEDATLNDHDFSATVPCVPTTSATIGATCALATTADALAPGQVVERKRAVWQMGQVRLFDGGSDALASTTADNRAFMVQGYMVP